MEKQNVLVIGGTGKTGRRVAAILKEEGHEVKVAGRSSVPAFDWENGDSYAPVLAGIDRAYIVYYPDLAVPGSREAISRLTREALAAGLKKVVLLSGKGESEAEACEEIVANSGLNYTLVRASWFNQNFDEGSFRDFVMQGVLALPMPDARIPFVDVQDIAEVVSKVLMDDSYNDQTITVTGPEKLTFKQTAEILSEVTGVPIQYVPISVEEFKAGMSQAGLPDSYVWLFGYLFKEVLGNPENQTISHDVKRLLGREATLFSDYAQQAAEKGAWDIER